MILIVGDPRCNNEQIQPGQTTWLKLNCPKVFLHHFYNTCWVASKICSEILEVLIIIKIIKIAIIFILINSF
jgi:hypothetical protein